MEYGANQVDTPEIGVSTATERLAGVQKRQRRMAEDAAWELARRFPTASAAHAPSRWQKRTLAMALILIAFGVFHAPGVIFMGVCVLVSGAALALASLRLAAVCTVLAKPQRTTTASHFEPHALPRITVLAPMFREANVARDAVRAFSALHYPAEKLETLFLTEASDHETRAALRAAPLGPGMRILTVPAGAPQTKPRALNFGLAHACGDIISVYDAEDRPHPDQLLAAAEAFAHRPRLACVQAPLGWYNAAENWLTRQFALEYAAQFHVILPALARWGWPLPLGGTSNHMRTEALRAVGGWDAHNVTEDADLGFRFARHGWHCDVIGLGTQEEAVTRLPAWMRQRSRWIKGFLQTWLVHLRQTADATRAPATDNGKRALPTRMFRFALGLHMTIGLSALASFTHGPLLVLLLAVSAAETVSGEPWSTALLVSWTFAGLGYGMGALTILLGLHRAHITHLWPALLTAPLYWAQHTPAAWRAVWSLARRPFHWDKTAHGVSTFTSEQFYGQEPVYGPQRHASPTAASTAQAS